MVTFEKSSSRFNTIYSTVTYCNSAELSFKSTPDIPSITEEESWMLIPRPPASQSPDCNVRVSTGQSHLDRWHLNSFYPESIHFYQQHLRNKLDRPHSLYSKYLNCWS
ncbi:hypothetical protein NQZ68_012104 [Dissostichus eleginoides]|nr:hypothetical protein NQZ68_012104 [Dissostichus eleginoides]